MEGEVLLFVVIDPGVLALVVGDQAATEVTALVQCAGQVQAAAIAVPATRLGAQYRLRLVGRALADHVDGRRSGTHAADQAGAAPDDLAPVVDGRVVKVVGQGRGGGNTVDREVGDGEAA